MMKRVCITAFLLLTCLVPLMAQVLPDGGLEPRVGSDVIGLEAWKKAWDEQKIDYLDYDITLKEGGVDLAEVSTDDMPCSGITTVEPTYAIDWVRDAIEEDTALRLFFVGTTDTTLAVQEPDGDWVCADNWEATMHPLIDFTQMRTGRYAIWVGLAAGGGSGRLVATVGDYDPIRLPPVTLDVELSFNGSGPGEAQLTYIEVDENSEAQTLDISIDLILKGKNRDQFRVWATLVDAATGAPIAAGAGDPQDDTGALAVSKELRLTGTFIRYDYGKKSKGAVELQLPLAALSTGATVYPVVRVEKLSKTKVWEEVVSYPFAENVYTP